MKFANKTIWTNAELQELARALATNCMKNLLIYERSGDWEGMTYSGDFNAMAEDEDGHYVTMAYIFDKRPLPVSAGNWEINVLQAIKYSNEAHPKPIIEYVEVEDIDDYYYMEDSDVAVLQRMVIELCDEAYEELNEQEELYWEW